MLRIDRESDAHVEPGHQILVLPYTEEGRALARLLTGEELILPYYNGREIRVPHNAIVDSRIVALINALADVRYQAPVFVQLTLVESVQPFVRILPDEGLA